MRGFSCFGWTAVSQDYLDELHHFKNLLADYKPAYEEAEEKRRDLTNLLKEKITLLQKTNLIRSRQDENLFHLKKDLQKTAADIEELKDQNATKETLIRKLNIKVEKAQDNFRETKHKMQQQKTIVIQQKEEIEELNDKIEMLEQLIESKNNDLFEKQETIKMKSEACEEAIQEKEEVEDKLNMKLLELIDNDNELSKQVFAFIKLEINYKKVVDDLKEKECELVRVKAENEKLKEKDKELIEHNEQMVQRITVLDNFETERNEIESMIKERQQELIDFRKDLDNLTINPKHLATVAKIREDLNKGEFNLEKMDIKDIIDPGCGDDLAQYMTRSEVGEDMEGKQIMDHMLPMQTSELFVTSGSANTAQNSRSLDYLPDRKNTADLSLLRSTSLTATAIGYNNSSDNCSCSDSVAVRIRK